MYQNKEKPGYYAVIPASVRYDKNVSQGAKLLYGEISALCNQKGYCWSRNKYFANLFETSERTIINWINSLKKNGHIGVSFSYVPGKKEVQTRYIKLIEPKKDVPPDDEPPLPDCPEEEPETEDFPQQATEEYNPEPQPQEEDRGVVKIFSPRGEEIFTGGVKNFSQGGENFFRENITYNITNNNSSEKNVKNSAASAPSEAKPPGKEAEALFSAKELKEALAKIDPALFLQNNFFNRAPPFMAKNSLGLDYLKWIYEQCRQTDFRSLKGLFFSMFFEDAKPLEFKAVNAPKPVPKPPPDFPCPVCEHFHPQSDEFCPSCSLPARSSQDLIILLRKLSPEKRKVYLEKSDDIALHCGADFDFF